MGTRNRRKLSASLEDYIEAIFNLAGESHEARSKDIAEALGVARSSVTGALQVLREKGLANYQPYGCITLTRQGRAAAREVVRKHDVLKAFFTDVLGVERETAQRAACQAEHALGPEVIGQLLHFMDYLTARSANGPDVPAEFRRFCTRRSAPSKERAVQE